MFLSLNTLNLCLRMFNIIFLFLVVYNYNCTIIVIDQNSYYVLIKRCMSLFPLPWTLLDQQQYYIIIIVSENGIIG